jgi:hypothetical protein
MVNREMSKAITVAGIFILCLAIETSCSGPQAADNSAKAPKQAPQLSNGPPDSSVPSTGSAAGCDASLWNHVYNPTRLQVDALQALYEYFHPISGGPDRNGWPFGRPVHVGEVYSVLQALRGTELVEDARLFGADPTTGQRGQAVQRLQIEPHALVFSYEHQVLVEGA